MFLKEVNGVTALLVLLEHIQYSKQLHDILSNTPLKVIAQQFKHNASTSYSDVPADSGSYGYHNISSRESLSGLSSSSAFQKKHHSSSSTKSQHSIGSGGSHMGSGQHSAGSGAADNEDRLGELSGTQPLLPSNTSSNPSIRYIYLLFNMRERALGNSFWLRKLTDPLDQRNGGPM